MKTYTPDICKALEDMAKSSQDWVESVEDKNDETRKIEKARVIALRRAASIIQESDAILRSFYEIAKRDGKGTAWPEVRRILDKELKRRDAKMPKILR